MGVGILEGKWTDHGEITHISNGEMRTRINLTSLRIPTMDLRPKTTSQTGQEETNKIKIHTQQSNPHEPWQVELDDELLKGEVV